MCNNINFFSKIWKMDKPKKILMGKTTFIRAEYQGDIMISSSSDLSCNIPSSHDNMLSNTKLTNHLER